MRSQKFESHLLLPRIVVRMDWQYRNMRRDIPPIEKPRLTAPAINTFVAALDAGPTAVTS